MKWLYKNPVVLFWCIVDGFGCWHHYLFARPVECTIGLEWKRLLFSIAIIWFVCSRFLAKSSARSTRTNTGNRNLFGHLLVWFDKFHRVVGSGFVECHHARHGKRLLWHGLFAQPVCCGSGAKKCPRHFAISKWKWHRPSNSFRIVFTTTIRQRWVMTWWLTTEWLNQSPVSYRWQHGCDRFYFFDGYDAQWLIANLQRL